MAITNSKGKKMSLTFDNDYDYVPATGGKGAEREAALLPTIDRLAENGMDDPNVWLKVTLPVDPTDEAGIKEWRNSWSGLANKSFDDARIFIKADGNVLRGRLLSGTRKPRTTKPKSEA